MKQPLIDLNILLDVLGQREPHYAASAEVWGAAERGEIHALVSADSFSTLYYLLSHFADARTARRGLSLVLGLFEVVTLDEKIIQQALDSPVRDFEDAVQYHSAIRGRADCIVTRDLRDYRKAELPIMSPEDFLKALS